MSLTVCFEFLCRYQATHKQQHNLTWLFTIKRSPDKREKDEWKCLSFFPAACGVIVSFLQWVWTEMPFSKSWIRNKRPHCTWVSITLRHSFPGEFPVRTDEVTHTCLFSRAAQESGKKNQLTLQTFLICKSHFFWAFWVCGWVGRRLRNTSYNSSAAPRLQNLIFVCCAGENDRCCTVIFPAWRGRAPALHLSVFYCMLLVTPCTSDNEVKHIHSKYSDKHPERTETQWKGSVKYHSYFHQW